MPSLNHFVLGLVMVTIAIVWAGCGKNAKDREATGAKSSSDDGGGSEGTAADDPALEPIAPEMLEQVKQMWSTQIAGMSAQLDTLKKLSAQYPDQVLSDYVTKLEGKVADMRKSFGSVTQANSAQVLNVDIPKMMGEAGELVSNANKRLQAVIKTSTGG